MPKAKKTGTTKTFVAIVLDESGSMGSMREAAVQMFNEQGATIKKNAKKGGDTKTSFFKFGQHAPPHVTEVFHAEPANKIPLLKGTDYEPQNGTPMRDGIGLAITRLEAEDDGGNDTAFLVIVVTDGQENQSREWSAERLREKVNELQATGRWTFAVYGANISLHDLEDAGVVIPAGNFAAYDSTAQDMSMASAGMSLNSANYFVGRAAGATASSTFTSTTDEDEAQVTVKRKPKLPR